MISTISPLAAFCRPSILTIPSPELSTTPILLKNVLEKKQLMYRFSSIHKFNKQIKFI